MKWLMIFHWRMLDDLGKLLGIQYLLIHDIVPVNSNCDSSIQINHSIFILIGKSAALTSIQPVALRTKLSIRKHVPKINEKISNLKAYLRTNPNGGMSPPIASWVAIGRIRDKPIESLRMDILDWILGRFASPGPDFLFFDELVCEGVETTFALKMFDFASSEI